MPTSQPLVSVLMPVYNGAEFLAETIESVLQQTYRNLELIIVNDGSTDDSGRIVGKFSDPRLHYLELVTNQGAKVARRTALEVAKGELISYIDQDDLFHPEKLEAHVQQWERVPATGVAYNSHLRFQGSPTNIKGLLRPPGRIALGDLVWSFPICPSDMVIRRDWAFRSFDIAGADDVWHGGEVLVYGGLFLDGCRFEFVDRVLNYRRAHSGRRVSNVEGNCEDYRKHQDAILDDPRCPDETRAMRAAAHSFSYVVWACYALAQGESEVGRRLSLEAVRLTPELLQGRPSELAARFVDFSLDDDSKDHRDVLTTIFGNLPVELSALQADLSWAVWRGYVLRGVQAAVWGDAADARECFRQAAASGQARLDDSALLVIGRQLLDYESVYGEAAASVTIGELAQRLEEGGFERCGRRIKALHSMNRAFREFEGKRYERVPEQTISAIARRPEYVFDKGVWSISVRSCARLLSQRLARRDQTQCA